MENVTAHKVETEAAVLELLAQGSNARTKGETQVGRFWSVVCPVPMPGRERCRHVWP